MGFDIGTCLERAWKGLVLPEPAITQLCEYVKDVVSEESNVVCVWAPAVVVGDVHGQFHDVLEMFEVVGKPPDHKFVFLGDYVDRGANSLETLVLLLCLKAKFPAHVTLLRGNHESRQITRAYGFYDECVKKYGTPTVWRACCDVFDYLPLAALVDNRKLCVHGGLSPSLASVDHMRTLMRCTELPNEGPLCDLMWSDPSEEVTSWVLNERGAGYLFGAKVALQFNRHNAIDLICRAHQLAMEGFSYHFPEKSAVTVWSAPNYCYRCGNKATVLKIDEHHNTEFEFFDEASSRHGISEEKEIVRNLYFL